MTKRQHQREISWDDGVKMGRMHDALMAVIDDLGPECAVLLFNSMLRTALDRCAAEQENRRR